LFSFRLCRYRVGKLALDGRLRLFCAIFVWDPISGSHQGQRPYRLRRNGDQFSIRKQAGYMAAPERFAQTSDSSCTAFAALRNLVVIGA
jgi:hypothetical protein